jgi:hypothetical protein
MDSTIPYKTNFLLNRSQLDAFHPGEPPVAPRSLPGAVAPLAGNTSGVPELFHLPT